MSYTKLRYHVIFGTKYRRPILHNRIESACWKMLLKHTRDLGGTPIAIGGVPDHVHLLAGLPSTLALSDYAKMAKRRTTRTLRAAFPHLSKFKWQVGFGGFTANPYGLDGLIDYIHNQKRHHAEDTLWKDAEL
jgi:REP element-mobilizing transposase RayT